MTEIPEHLLKRAAERRAAMGQGGDAPADAPAADGGAPAASAAPAAVEKKAAAPAPLPTLESEAPKAKPDSPVVAAAKRRKRIPYWAAPVLALFPLWGIMYVSAVQPPPAGDTDPLVIGGEVYTLNCAGCHLGNGAGASAGGTGASLIDNGGVVATFADPLSQAYWIHYASADGARPDGTYGDLDRPGGPHNIGELTAQMGGFSSLSAEELAAVVIYIRQELDAENFNIDDDPNFNSELFEADPSALAKMIEEVIALPAGDPDAVSTVEGAEGN